jgi:hypothetical protein
LRACSFSQNRHRRRFSSSLLNLAIAVFDAGAVELTPTSSVTGVVPILPKLLPLGEHPNPALNLLDKMPNPFKSSFKSLL